MRAKLVVRWDNGAPVCLLARVDDDLVLLREHSVAHRAARLLALQLFEGSAAVSSR